MTVSGVQICAIISITFLAYIRHKKTDQVPVLFMTTAIFLLLSNIAVFIRSFLEINFCLNGAYYMFARRYSHLSFDLMELQRKT